MSNVDRQLIGPLGASMLRDCWRDRISGWPLAKILMASHCFERPPWWRFVARWRWSKAAKRLRAAAEETK